VQLKAEDDKVNKLFNPNKDEICKQDAKADKCIGAYGMSMAENCAKACHEQKERKSKALAKKLAKCPKYVSLGFCNNSWVKKNCGKKACKGNPAQTEVATENLYSTIENERYNTPEKRDGFCDRQAKATNKCNGTKGKWMIDNCALACQKY
jgi:hypothetical protein